MQNYYMASREMSELDRAFAMYMRRRMAELMLTQAELADRIEMPRPTFGRYYRGERSVTLGDMRAIIRGLGDDPSQIVRTLDEEH